MSEALLHLYEALCAWLACYGYPPTVRELAMACASSPTAVHYHLVRLRALRLVTWRDGCSRTLRVVGTFPGK